MSYRLNQQKKFSHWDQDFDYRTGHQRVERRQKQALSPKKQQFQKGKRRPLRNSLTKTLHQFFFQHKVTFSMSKTSLFLFICGLMFLGALFFLGGFLAAFTALNIQKAPLVAKNTAHSAEEHPFSQKIIQHNFQSNSLINAELSHYGGSRIQSLPSTAQSFAYYADHADNPELVTPYFTKKVHQFTR